METEKYTAKTMPSGIQSTALDPAVIKVLRNTYMLLGVTLAFSAAMAGVAMSLNVPHFGLWTLLPYFLCLWMTEKNKNNASGILWVFALTGWLGFTLGPILICIWRCVALSQLCWHWARLRWYFLPLLHLL